MFVIMFSCWFWSLLKTNNNNNTHINIRYYICYIFGLGCNGTISDFIGQRTDCLHEQRSNGNL